VSLTRSSFRQRSGTGIGPKLPLATTSDRLPVPHYPALLFRRSRPSRPRVGPSGGAAARRDRSLIRALFGPRPVAPGAIFRACGPPPDASRHFLCSSPSRANPKRRARLPTRPGPLPPSQLHRPRRRRPRPPRPRPRPRPSNPLLLQIPSPPPSPTWRRSSSPVLRMSTSTSISTTSSRTNLVTTFGSPISTESEAPTSAWARTRTTP
jgi:hypothetical protein